MKNLRSLGGLLGLLAVLAFAAYGVVVWDQPVQAQNGFKFTESDGSGFNGNGGASGEATTGDSTVFTLLNRTAADITAATLTTVGKADTTKWFDLSGANFADCNFAGQPLIKVAVNNANAASGDSIAYVMQYSQDKSVIFSKSAGTFTGAAPYSAVLLICDTNANEAALGYRYIRLIVYDNDVTNTSSFYNTSLKMSFLSRR